MNVLESIVGNLMKVRQFKLQKVLKLVLSTLTIAMLVSISLSFGLSQETTSTLTPVQIETETDLSPQDAATTEENVSSDSTTQGGTAQGGAAQSGAAQGAAVVTTTVTTTPIEDVSNPESRVCDALANQIRSNLADYSDWQISLNDDYGNVQGTGEMGPDGLELQLFDQNAGELYLYYFTDAEAITIANSSGLRISLFERDGSGANSRGIIINATIGKNREALPINECILPFENVFPNYVIK